METRRAIQSVVDLGLRDVGVRNEPRRFAVHFAKWFVPLAALVVLSVVALCAVVIKTDVGATSAAVAFMVTWTVGGFLLAVQMARRSPPMVIKIRADGSNQAAWVMIVPSVLLALAGVLLGHLLALPLLVLTVLMALLVWRARGRIPDMLRRLQPLLASGESVLGDGIGVVRDRSNRKEALRLVVATDRRLLVASSSRSPERFLVIDVPYRLVSRFGIEWRRFVQTGQLSVTAPRIDGGGDETHLITSIAPGNLLSIARALQAHDVPTDDAGTVAEMVQAWEEGQDATAPPERLFDRAEMTTPAFDRGLWLFLALCAFTFYLNPFGIGLGVSRGEPLAVLVGVLAASVIAGYLSGTRASLAYIAPLNLLVAPAFFFVDAGLVIACMIVVSALAALGLPAGSALRRLTIARADAGRERPAGPARALVLIRLSAILLVVLTTLVTVTAAAGFDLTSLGVKATTVERVPADGRSNLNGNAASLTYARAPDLREYIADEHWDAGPNDGARWELRSSRARGNVLSLAHYIFTEPRLDNAAAVADFVAEKDGEHADSAGRRVTHTERVVDGRKGYVWTHIGRGGYWLYAAWFPHPVHSVRFECVAKKELPRFKRLCAEAMSSLKFH